MKSKSASGYIKKNTFELCGYGENDIGPFTLRGQVTLINPDKIIEKAGGVGNFKRIKLANFKL